MIYDKIKESMKTKSDYKEVFNFGLDENILIKGRRFNIHLYNNILYIIENKKITLIVSLFEEKYRLDYFNSSLCADVDFLDEIFFEIVYNLYDCVIMQIGWGLEEPEPVKLGVFYDKKRIPDLKDMVLSSFWSRVATMCLFLHYEEYRILRRNYGK